MHILYFSWEENCKIDMLDTLSRIDFQCSLITAPQNNYRHKFGIFKTSLYHAAFFISASSAGRNGYLSSL